MENFTKIVWFHFVSISFYLFPICFLLSTQQRQQQNTHIWNTLTTLFWHTLWKFVNNERTWSKCVSESETTKKRMINTITACTSMFNVCALTLNTQAKLIQHEIFNEWNPMWLVSHKNIVIVCDFYFLRHEIPMKKNKMTKKTTNTNTHTIKVTELEKQNQLNQLTCTHKCEISWTVAPLSHRPIAQISSSHARTHTQKTAAILYIVKKVALK